MEKKHLIRTSIFFASLAIASITFSTIGVYKVIYASSGDWWSNSCILPSGYTDIETILSNPVVDKEYTTRGTITSIEDRSFFIQSRSKAIYIYNTTLNNSMKVGNVVDVTGTLALYAGTYEILPTDISLYAETNPYPVVAEIRDPATFNTDPNFGIGKYIEMPNLTINVETSFAITNTIVFENDIQCYMSSNSRKEIIAEVKQLASDYPNIKFKFAGIESVYNTTREIRVTDMSCLDYEISGEDIKATSISITDNNNQVLVGNSFRFVATVLPKGTKNKEVTWTTTAGSSITSEGVFTSNIPGTYTVTATTTDGTNLSASANIEVLDSTDIGFVIEEPCQNGSVLGPMYVPGKKDIPSISYLEMVSQYGDSIIFDYGNFEMVIDGGNGGDGQNVRKAIKEHCEDGQIEILMLSHPHGDHYGAFNKRINFEESTGVSKIKYIINSEQIDPKSTLVYYGLFNSYISEGTIAYDSYSMVNNSSSNFPNVFQITSDISLRILDTGVYVAPGGNKPENTNDMSIASLLSVGNTNYFLCGDLTGTPEKNVVNKYGSLGYWDSSTYNIVKANHHCSNTHSSNSSTWINSIKPDIVVASCAIESKNRKDTGPISSQHPTIGSVERYLAATENFYCNMINGTITFTHNKINGIPTMSFAGRTIDYYTSDGVLVDKEAERTIKFQESEFYKALYLNS